MSITLDGTNGVTASSPATIKASAYLDAAGGNTATINGIIPSALPSGMVATFAMNTAPTGWLKADGTAISRSTYAALFTAIGTTFGVGDGSTTFNVPDLRGEFTRNWDDARGIDAGRVFGSAQATRVNNIQTVTGNSGFDTGGPVTVNDDGTTSLRLFSGANNTPQYSHSFTKKGGDTYPRNIALLACIKI